MLHLLVVLISGSSHSLARALVLTWLPITRSPSALATPHPSQATDHSHVSHEPRPAPRLSSETRVPSVAEQEEIRTLTMATQKHDKEGSGEQRVDKTKVDHACPFLEYAESLETHSRWALDMPWFGIAVPSFSCFWSFHIELWWLESFLSETLSWENYLKQNIFHQS